MPPSMLKSRYRENDENQRAARSTVLCSRKLLSPSEDVLSGELLTIEQVRRATDVVIATSGLSRRDRDRKLAHEAKRQQYYARRNAAAARSHQKTCRKRLKELGIDLDKIKYIAVS